MSANQIIIETTMPFGIVNLYAAPDTSWTKAIRGSADDRGYAVQLGSWGNGIQAAYFGFQQVVKRVING